MNLQELIDELQAHPSTIDLLELEDHGDYIFYRLTYLIEANIANQMSICVLIQNRGEAEETAYYKEGLPPLKSEFRQELEAAVSQYQAGHPELEYWRIVTLDEQTERAILDCYVYNSTNDESEQDNYLVIKGTPWQFRKIV